MNNSDIVEVEENKDFYFNTIPSLAQKFKETSSKFIEVKDVYPINNKEVRLFCKTKDYIGFIKLPNEKTLFIKPKFGNANFVEMLIRSQTDYVHLLKNIVKTIDPADFFKFFEVLINNFLMLLKNLQLRKTYDPKIKNTKQIKGRILLYRSLQKEQFLSGEFICQFDDFNHNSLENQIIKYTLLGILYFSNPFQKRVIKKYLKNFNKVQYKKILIPDFKRLRYNRLNFHYKPVHVYCRFFIEKFIFGALSGNREINSFLVNSWDVYERFLRQIFRDYLTDYEVLKDTFYDESDNKFEIDILIRKTTLNEKRVYLIADAKYKIEYDRRDDVGQMLRYLRFFTKQSNWSFPEGHRYSLLIYPRKDDDLLSESDEILIDYDEGHEIGNIKYTRIDLSKISDEKYIKKWVKNIKSKLLTPQ